MAYLDATEFEALLDSDEAYGDEGWEKEALDEAAPPSYRRTYSGRGSGLNLPRPSAARPIGGLTGVRLNTPAGKADVKFDKAVATKESVEALAKELKAEIRLQGEAIKKVDQTVDKNTAILDKKIAGVTANLKKAGDTSSMAMMLPMLLAKPPALESIKLGELPAGGAGKDSVIPIADSKYKPDDNTMLLLALMLGGGFGGSGSGSGTSDSSTMLLLVLALSGGFGGKK